MENCLMTQDLIIIFGLMAMIAFGAGEIIGYMHGKNAERKKWVKL